ncbi:hypothetical protein V6U71_08815 [Sphingopyxis sp. J-6]|uniref:hypothetical protein n=1 Tax=Sphingopyxis sp. J-6 TaxID=3122054 RepID=UPI003984058A
MGEILSAAFGAIADFFMIGAVDRGLQKHRWLQIGCLALFAVVLGLVAGCLIRSLI